MNARELHMSRPDQDATVEATPPPPEPEPASKGGKSNAMAARLAAFQQPASDGGGPKPFTGGAAAPRAQTLPAKCGLAAKFESQAAVGAESTTLDGAASRARSFGSGGGGIAARAAGLQFNPAMLSPGGAPKSPMPKASSAPDVEDGVGESQGAVAAEAPKPDGFAPRTPTLPAKCGLAAKFESQAAVGPEAPKLDGAASRTRSFGSGGGGIAARAAGLQFNPAMLSPGGMPKPRQSSSASASEREEGAGGALGLGLGARAWAQPDGSARASTVTPRAAMGTARGLLRTLHGRHACARGSLLSPPPSRSQECREFKNGRCSRGDACRFNHVGGPTGGSGGGSGAAFDERRFEVDDVSGSTRPCPTRSALPSANAHSARPTPCARMLTLAAPCVRL